MFDRIFRRFTRKRRVNRSPRLVRLLRELMSARTSPSRHQHADWNVYEEGLPAHRLVPVPVPVHSRRRSRR